MTTPVRIQRKRINGWRMPPNTVSVCRPGKWGNPYAVSETMTAELAVTFYREHLESALRQWPSTREALGKLRGKNLACWCRLDRPCHADVLLELANG